MYNFLKLDSKLLRLLLGALSFEYDKQLIKKGENPTDLRKVFFERFHRNFSILDDKYLSEKITEELTKEIKRTDLDFLIFDSVYEGSETYSCKSCGCEWICHLLIWKEEDIYKSCYVKISKETHMGMEIDETGDGFITIEDIKNANFIDITLEYEQIIRTICEKWGYNNIISYIKNNK